MGEEEEQAGVVDRARAAHDAGAAWRARDLLAAHVEAERDPEALALLAEILDEMGDLPRAGAMWFASGARGPEVDAAVSAWREQTGDDFGAMWHSLPASVRAEPRPRRIEALRERAMAVEHDHDGSPGDATGAQDSSGPTESVGAARPTGPGASDDPGTSDDDGFDAAWLVAWILAAAFVVFAVIGFVTVLAWLVPG